MIDYKKAFENSVKYLENEWGCCPACCDNALEKDKCTACNMRAADNRSRIYNEQLSIQCWKEIFM